MSEEREELEARIAAYIDGELPEAEAARLEVFLANTDPALAEQVIGMLGDKHKMQGLPKTRAPEELLAHVMEKVERATLLNDVEHLTHPRRSWWQSRLSTAAAVIVLVGGFGVVVYKTVVRPVDSKWPAVVNSGKKPAPMAEPILGADKDFAEAPRGIISPAKPDASKRGQVETDALAAASPTPRHMALKTGPEPVITAEHTPLLEKSVADGDSMKKASAADEAELVKSEEVVQKQLAKSELLVQSGPAEASNMGYVSADSAAKALSNLSVQGSMASTNPIVVTLVARDDTDPEKLRIALERFMADPSAANRQAILQNRYNGANSVFRNNSTLTLNGAFDNNGNLSSNPTNPNNNGDNPVIAGNAIAGNVGNSTSNISNITNTGGNVTANNTTVRDNYRIYNSGQFDVNDGVGANGNTVTNGNSVTNSIANGNKMKAQAGQQLTRQQNDFGSPYRVVLRQDQLQQLTADFRVYSMSCGSQAYVITEPETRVAGIGGGGTMHGKGGGEYEKSNGSEGAMAKAGKAASPPAATARPASTPAPTTPVEGMAGDRKDSRESQQLKASASEQKQEFARQSAATTQPMAPQAEQQADKNKWVDCVIKMEPRPTLNLQQLNAPAQLNKQSQQAK